MGGEEFVHVRRSCPHRPYDCRVLSDVPDSGAGRLVFGTFGIAVLALVLWVVNRSPTINWIAWLLAVPAVLLSLLADVVDAPQLMVFAHMLEAALYFYAAVGLIIYMFGDQRVTLDELLAVGATFTLLAWAWAFAFSVCQAWYPGSFTGPAGLDTPRTWIELRFMGFSVLSGSPATKNTRRPTSGS